MSSALLQCAVWWKIFDVSEVLATSTIRAMSNFLHPLFFLLGTNVFLISLSSHVPYIKRFEREAKFYIWQINLYKAFNHLQDYMVSRRYNSVNIFTTAKLLI
jgi:hypothetical protein